MSPPSPSSFRTGIDWSQMLYPGPARAFSADEMARAGSDPPSRTLVVAALANAVLLVVMLAQLAPAQHRAGVVSASLTLLLLTGAGAQWLWWRPWRRPLMQTTLLLLALTLLLAVAVRWLVPEREERYWLAAATAGGGVLTPMLLWFLVIWRAQQIGGRLREQAERERAIEMARRLATAQIEPHFLFNTLASLQHWVQTKDDRAAPLLSALTGYLRATLPLFDRPQIVAADELLAVERYLQVMQSRLGARLQFAIEVDAGLRNALLPPGLLLTLVENAIVHGIEPRLAGGRIVLRGLRQGGDAVFEIEDNGPGLPPELHEGVGLSNLRERLTLSGGASARLQLDNLPEGGCRARFQLPHRTE